MSDYHRDNEWVISVSWYRHRAVHREFIIWKWNAYKILQFIKPSAGGLIRACESWVIKIILIYFLQAASTKLEVG